MGESSINTLIGTFSAISQIANREITNNLICIDTSENRIGINTIDPSYSIHIIGNDSSFNGIYTPRLYFDLSRIIKMESSQNTDNDVKLRVGLGQVYMASNGYLRVRTD